VTPATQAAAHLLAECAEREARIEREAYHAGYGAGHADGDGDGYRRAHAEIEASQAALNRELVAGARVLDDIERARREPSRSGYCREPGCRVLVSVPYRTRYDLIRCQQHMPRRWCAEHRDTDTCAFIAHQEQTREPEYTGGPASSQAWEQWAAARQQAGRGTAA